jgi:hypothetical protein
MFSLPGLPAERPLTAARSLRSTWSSRKLPAELGDVSFATVQRVWRKHGVGAEGLEAGTGSADDGGGVNG